MTETIVLGGGCFWCLEAVFLQIKGIAVCESGYSGGADPAPTYEKIGSGKTGHAEVTRLHFDPDIISFRKILAIFFAIHDPTSLNRQGNDIGTQYRSVVFYHTEAQKEIVKSFIHDMESQKIYAAPVVTEVSPLINYFPAEAYHQNYFENNPTQSYCAYVVAPKLHKAEDLFSDLFKRHN